MASTARQRRIVGIPTPWLGLLTGPIMWSLHLIVAWMLIEALCETGLAVVPVLGIGLAYLIISAATVLLLGATIAAGIVAYQDWRRGGGGNLADDEAEKARPFLAFGGVMSSILFGFAIALATYPLLLLPPCAGFGAALPQVIRPWA
jgi:hypothetical protein